MANPTLKCLALSLSSTQVVFDSQKKGTSKVNLILDTSVQTTANFN